MIVCAGDIKMRLRLVAGSVIFLLCSQAPNALSQTIVTCPTSITCNYDAGTCQYPSGWYLEYGGASSRFEGNLTIKLISPTGYVTPPIAGNSHGLRCYYYYDIYSNANFSLFTNVDELVGSGWTKTGFGNKEFKCVTDPRNPDVTACAGSRGN